MIKIGKFMVSNPASAEILAIKAIDWLAALNLVYAYIDLIVFNLLPPTGYYKVKNSNFNLQ